MNYSDASSVLITNMSTFTPSPSLSVDGTVGTAGTFYPSAFGTAGTFDPDAVMTLGTFDPDQVGTLDPNYMVVDPYYFGDDVNMGTVIGTLFLFLAASFLNLGVLNHYWNRVKSIESVVPFLCFLLSLCNFAVGICAGLHTILFAVILATKGDPPSSLMLLVVPAYYLSFLAFKVLAFVCMVVTVIRSINMSSPVYRIKRSAVVISIVAWLCFWAAIALLEMALYVNHVGWASFSNGDVTKSFLIAFFYQPGKPRVVELMMRLLISEDDFGDMAASVPECVIDMLYTALPLITCVGVSVVCVFTQGVVHLTGICGDEKDGRYTLTMILKGVVFIVCSSTTLHQPFSVCVENGAQDWKSLYLMGYLPFFLLSVLSPLVLVARVPQLRKCLKNKVTRNSCGHCNSVKYAPV